MKTRRTVALLSVFPSLRGWWRVLAGLLLVSVAIAGSPRVASAHALYEKSQPASGAQLEAPGQIQVWFTEAVEPTFSVLEVLDVSRKRVDLQDTHAAPGESRALLVSVPELPDGTYMVAWRALSSVDGHVTRGVFPLVVGAGGLTITVEDEPVALPNPLDVVTRWIIYTGSLALAGGFIFRLLVARASLRRLTAPALVAAFDARVRRYGLLICAAVALAMLLGILVQAANAANVAIWEAAGAPFVRLLGTQVGTVWLARLGSVAVLALLLWRAPARLLDWAGLVVGSALLLAISFISHAAAVPNGVWLALLMDWLHQFAAAAWVGGLFSFVLLLLLARTALQDEARTRFVADLVPRFSSLALIAVAVLALTGLFHSWLQVKTPSALGTLFGGALVVKLLLIAPMLVLGAMNLLIARSRLGRLTAGRRRSKPAKAADGVPLVRRFNRAIVAESVLALGVLLATGFLTSVQPAREEYARKVRPIELVGQAEDVGIRLQITPARPGPNQFVAFLDGNVAPPNDVQRVQLRFTNIDDDLGASALVLTPRPEGGFGAVSTNITVDGTWQIEVVVRRRGLDDVRTAFRTPVTTPDLAAQPPSLDAVPDPLGFSPRQWTSMMLMALGLALAYWISRTRDVRKRERLTLYAASMVVAFIGGVLYARATVVPRLPTDIRALQNPFAPDTASIARGREIYEQQCASCHGLTGRGDGPLAASLRPRPADFRVHMAAGHTDGELFTWLSRGVPGTAMPGFEGQLSETDRWHTVNYIRGFAPSSE
jgi:copper transport protein